MRIGFVNTGTIQQNASTLRCLQLGNLLIQDGHEVFLFLSGQPENRARYGEEYNGIQMRYTAVGMPYEQISKAQSISSVKLDYIHCMSSGSSVHFPGWLAKWRQNGDRPCLIMDFDEWQSLWLRYPKRLYQAAWEIFACKFSDRVIFASRYLMEQLGRYVDPHRRFYLPYAVDGKQFTTNSCGWENVRKQYAQRRLVVYMGSLLPQFDAGRVLDTVKDVSRAEPDVLFLFIGAGQLQNEFEHWVSSERLDRWVKFTGYMSDKDMAQHLCAADVLLFPIQDTVLNRSRSPNKIFHYLAARRPIVTNPLKNVQDILGEYALYFDFDSTSDFVQKILFALREGVPIPPKSLVAQHTYANRYSAYLDILAGQSSGI